MISHLLDTSVFSQPVRNARSRVAAAVSRWQKLGDARLAVSIVAYAETRLGIELAGNAQMRATFTRALEGRLKLLETDQSVWNEFVLMKARQTQIGQPVNDFDLLIAATARVHNLTVATLNRRDFSRIEGLAWEDWSL